MVVPYLDFRKSSEPARSPCLIQPTQNQVQKLLHSTFATEHLHHFSSPLHLFGQPLQLVRGVEVAANGPWMTQESQKSTSFGFLTLHDLGIDRAPLSS